MGQDKWTFDDSFFMDYMIRGGDAHWLAIGGTFTVASGNELTKPRQNMKVKMGPLAFFQSLSRSIMH